MQFLAFDFGVKRRMIHMLFRSAVYQAHSEIKHKKTQPQYRRIAYLGAVFARYPSLAPDFQPLVLRSGYAARLASPSARR
eukprot:731219-Rhodomonas_salina.1